MASAAGDNVLNISILSDKQLMACITQLDEDCGPITTSTRGVYERKLAKLRLSGVTGRRTSDSVGNGSPTRSTHIGISSTESSRKLLGDIEGNTSICSTLSKNRQSVEENENIISDLSFEDEDNPDNASFVFNVSRDGEVSTTTAHINSFADSAVKPSKEFNTKAASAAASALKTIQDKISARNSAAFDDNTGLNRAGGRNSGYSNESVDPSRNEQRQVLRDFSEENRKKEGGSQTKSSEMFENSMRYRGVIEDIERKKRGTNESNEGKYRSQVAERLDGDRIDGGSERERERVGKENYDSFSSTYYSSTLTRPALESLTRPPLHPESKKIYDSESDEESFTMLSQHELNNGVNQSIRQTDAPAVRSGIPFLFKIIIPVAVIIFIVCIMSFIDPEFANPVKP